MNTQKYVVASIAAAVFFFIYGYVVYDMLLADYVASITPTGMMMESGQNILFIALGCLIEALGLGLLYVKGHEGKGAMEGVRFGLFVGIFMLGYYVLMAGVSPYTIRAAITFGIIDTIMYMGGGVCFAMLYKK